jgi:hypothetical protein
MYNKSDLLHRLCNRTSGKAHSGINTMSSQGKAIPTILFIATFLTLTQINQSRDNNQNSFDRPPTTEKS